MKYLIAWEQRLFMVNGRYLRCNKNAMMSQQTLLSLVNFLLLSHATVSTGAVLSMVDKCVRIEDAIP